MEGFDLTVDTATKLVVFVDRRMASMIRIVSPGHTAEEGVCSCGDVCEWNSDSEIEEDLDFVD
jgi:hypothetical protein